MKSKFNFYSKVNYWKGVGARKLLKRKLNAFLGISKIERKKIQAKKAIRRANKILRELPLI